MIKKNNKLKINWYAGTADIKWIGPYKSELEAWNAVQGLDGLPVSNARVWCTTDTYTKQNVLCNSCGHEKHVGRCPAESYNGYRCRCSS